MTTVQEFNDLGVEILYSDKVQFRHGNQVGVIAFAWRPLNTLPDNPKFKYEKSEFDSFWRPLLDQSTLNPVNDAAVVKPSDAKPVFTQAMADDCMPLQAGMLFESECGKYEAILVNKKSVCFEDENGWLVTMPIGKVKPVRTPKQKAVDAACESIGQGHNTIVINIVGELYDNGFIKC